MTDTGHSRGNEISVSAIAVRILISMFARTNDAA
jgi:hypothetical protein